MSRQSVYAGLAVVLSLALSLVGAELLLEYLQERIRHSDRLDSGLLVYDPTLGWRTRPDWQGRHRHHDFDVAYRTGADGFRDSPDHTRAGRQVLVLGDSFTFGFGVDDRDTFCNLLNRRLHPDAIGIANLGIPGFSTDQEYLLLKQVLRQGRAAHALLVVYVANDLLDITRDYPLQAEYAKPRFELEDDGRLALRNVPVPLQHRPITDTAAALASIILPPADRRTAGPRQWLGSRELVRRLGWTVPASRIPTAHLDRVFAPSLRLFGALLHDMREWLARHGAGLSVVLLPGRSWLVEPGSHSAQFQDYLLEQLGQQITAEGVGWLSLAPALRDANDGAGLFFPYDGHLTSQGHAWVAAQLDGYLRRAVGG